MRVMTIDVPASVAADLRSATRVAVLTGAGISAPSGLPTYRQSGSGWSDPDLEAKSAASRYGNHLPELWQFWGALRAAATAAEPNAAHLALTRAQQRCADRDGWLRVTTQNVDGLHTDAGTLFVNELHGSIHRTRCMRRACRAVFTDDRLPEPGAGLSCPTCGSRARPDVTLFGEQLPPGARQEAVEAMQQAQVCVYVGTSGNVWPAADLVSHARKAGALCVLVNADPWEHPHPDFHHTVLGPAQHLLPALLG